MNSDAFARKRKHRLQLAARTTARTTREKKTPQEDVRQPLQTSEPGQVETAQDVADRSKLSERDIRPTSPTGHEDTNARLFTVGNVGANGTLYLQPMRTPVGIPRHPTTPPDTADGKEHRQTKWSDVRYSTQSGAYTPRLHASRAGVEHDLALPGASVRTSGSRRPQRSHSFSTISDRSRPSTFDANAFNSMLGDQPTARPKSFTGSHSTSLLDLSIPNYRLGTPRFGERGSAYIQGSAYSSMVSGHPSSVIPPQDYDKIFPRPPGKATATTFLHPSRAKSGRRTIRDSGQGPSLPATAAAKLANLVEIEAHANSPALVRYDASTGRILAATPARLIAQITSPVFLDYELLSDFFLTYRCFMSAYDAMDSILARLDWALSTTSDAGQIVRVRTFVALRHWMLNYFIDDFAHDVALRQQFCNNINLLSRTLQSQPDGSGKVTEMNILEELKKCWRRTCAMFWPSPDSLNVQPGTDIVPGGMPFSPQLRGSTRGRRSFMSTRRLTKNSDQPWQSQTLRLSTRRNTIQSFETDFAAMTGKQASIPASPMSEESLEVLSCSVPFLRHVQQTPSAGKYAPRPVASHRTKTQTDAPSRPRHQHKRSGSFSDALRDVRQSQPPLDVKSIDFRSSPAIALTGGLVRGLLLQPCPAKVDVLVPLSPPLEDYKRQRGTPSDSYFHEQQYQNTAVKKIVGEMRRALSARKHRHDSPARSHRSTQSTSLRSGGSSTQAENSATTNGQALQGLLGRMDMLGARASESYQQVFGHLLGHEAIPDGRSNMDNVPEGDEHENNYNPDKSMAIADGADHRLTAGSRSIVIGMDPAINMDSLTLPDNSFRSWSNTIAPAQLRSGSQPPLLEDSFTFARLDSGVASDDHAFSGIRRMAFGPRAASDSQLSQKLSMPPPWREEHLSPEPLRDFNFPRRASSGIELPAFLIDPAIQQLRRVPGGDLKLAEHIHDLQLLPRRHTSGYSLSAYSRSQVPSAYQFSLASGAKYSAYGGQPSWKKSQSRVRSTSLQLLETHSLRAHLRPSYQAQFAHLRRLTPGLDSGGGIEDALLKLEGKVDSPAKSTFNPTESGNTHLVDALSGPGFRPHDSVDTSRGIKSEYGPSIALSQGIPPPTHYATQSFSADNLIPLDDNVTPTTDVQGASIFNASRSSAAMSYGSGLDRARSQTTSSPAWNLEVPTVVLPRASMASRPTTHDTRHSFQLPLGDLGWTIGGIDDESGGLTSLRRRSTRMRKSVSTLHSLLLDDNESLSDISTEIGGHAEDDDYGARTFSFDDTMCESAGLANRPYRPPTPPSSVPTGSHSSGESAHQPTTPLPYVRFDEMADKTIALAQAAQRYQADARSSIPMQALTSHMPFILAFESEVIAEQFSIIEKDALDEVDWKDLISLKWVQAPPAIRNWADYLNKQDEYNGIDIAITRFNLVVKWVISECILTDSPGERARCITKYIHIATHCRRFRNFASCYQITVALLSSVLSGLHKTWALVSVAEKAMLESLELLCQPTRNFHNLRVEMEASSMERGCIPFIGLYTHDLKLNAQKSAMIDVSPHEAEPLVNFERYQTAASIVKSLLRLIEASSKYIFRPHPEALSRCLWLAALEDAEISARCKGLEQ